MHRAFLPILLLLGTTPVHADVLPITVCGQVVGRGRVGVLMTDLDCGQKWGTCRLCTTCSEDVEPPVPCSSSADCPDPAVHRCYSGTGPDGSVAGVHVLPGGRLQMRGHSIRNARDGVAGFGPDGVGGRGVVRVTGPGTISATREAIAIGRGTVSGVTLRDSVYGVVGGSIRLIDVTASANDIGVSAFEKVSATRLTADDNRYLGLLSYARARVVSSHLTGNVYGDISTEGAPRLTDTVCDHSALLVETAQPGIYLPTGPPFDVCALD